MYKFCSKSAPWIIKDIGLSNGPNGENKGCYFENSTTKSEAYMIEICTMVFQSPVVSKEELVTH